jgi:pSer/pThr/pTyr-binding forkhead associated (FHA) protein
VPRLLIAGDDGSERIVELTERTLQIGRGPGNDIVLADATQGVSRTHAELRFRNGRCVIVDLESQNGTWINGHRVQHAEVPPDAEIAVGNYRLRVLPDSQLPSDDESPGTSSHPPATSQHWRGTGAAPANFPDVPLVRSYDAPPITVGSTQRTASGPNVSQSILLAGFIVAVSAFAWRMVAPTTTGAAFDRIEAQPSPRPADLAESSPQPASSIPDSVPPSTPSPAPVPAAETRPLRSPESRTPTVAVRPDASPVAQRPGESTEAWRARMAAFQTRYVYSRAALQRGDFAAAAGGFEAILREEPGFMDVPLLLLQARAGLRAAAVDLFEIGQRLEAAGEWLGALQKYEQARQVHADVPGLTQAVRGVREKLRVAGSNAFNRARQLDGSGLSADALKEYEKAVQWLPADDPNRELARGRAEELKRAVR